MGLSATYAAKLRAGGKCPRLCFGGRNPIAGLPCERKKLPGGDGVHCRVHQPGYVVPGKRVTLAEQLSAAREALTLVVAAWENSDDSQSLNDVMFGAKRVLRGEPFDQPISSEEPPK